MPKGKSSATSATRKKHARKADGDSLPLPLPPKKPKAKKGEKPEPKAKQYIPRSRPAPVQTDPLDSLGLAAQLDKDVVVILRRLAKKDAVTRAKAVEDLRSWADNDDTGGVIHLVPVWLHHLPSLLLHPSRRLRLLTSSLNDHLLENESVRSAFLYFVRENTDVQQTETLIGTLCLSAWDIDRAVSREGIRTWNRVVQWRRPADGNEEDKLTLQDDELEGPLTEFLCKGVLEPEALYMSVFPPAPNNDSKLVYGKPQANAHDDAPRRSEGDEEGEEDRNARLRAASLAAIRWIFETRRTIDTHTEKLLHRLTSHPMPFTALYHDSNISFLPGMSGPGFGANQPLVRRAAWGFLQSVIQPLSLVGATTHVPRISKVVLYSAWSEPDSTVRSLMWEPLLTYLKIIAGTWLHAAAPLSDNPIENSEDEDKHASSPVREHLTLKPVELVVATSSSTTTSLSDSEVHRRFLRFLELGCGGSPSQGYPTLVVILSTIPSEILPCNLPALENLFSSIWAAYDGKALSSSLERERRESVGAFVASLSECVGVYARKLFTGTANCDVAPEDSKLMALSLVKQQWDRLLDEALQDRFRLPEPQLGGIISKGLSRLHTVNSDLFDAAWTLLSSILITASPQAHVHVINLLAQIGAEASAHGEDSVNHSVNAVATKWVREVMFSPIFYKEPMDPAGIETLLEILTQLLQQFRNQVIVDVQLSQEIVTFVNFVFIAKTIFQVTPATVVSFFLAYILTQPDQAHKTWREFLRIISANWSEERTAAKRLLLAVATDSRFPHDTLDASDVLSEFVLSLATASLQYVGSDSSEAIEENTDLLNKLLSHRVMFVDQQTLGVVQKKLEDFFEKAGNSVLYDGFTEISTLYAIRLLPSFIHYWKTDSSTAGILTVVFFLAHGIHPNPSCLAIWISWKQIASPEVLATTYKLIVGRIKAALTDVTASISPTEALTLAVQAGDITTLHHSSGLAGLPPPDYFESQLSSPSSYAPHPSLFLIDSLIPSSSAISDFSGSTVYDTSGFSLYARVSLALLMLLVADRKLVQDHVWAIRHLSAVEILAKDFIALPGQNNLLFSGSVTVDFVMDTAINAQQTLAYSFSSVAGDLSSTWHQTVTNSLSKAKIHAVNDPGFDDLQNLIIRCYTTSAEDDTVISSRILHGVLRGLLRNGTSKEGDMWLMLAHSLIDTAPQTALAIIHCIAGLNLESPRLDRIRNELSSRLSGVKSANSNKEGLRLLRLLNASAPPADSETTFLPQQRIIFMSQTLKKWVEENDELDEEIESQLAGLFFHLVAPLQSLPGAHWDFIQDVIESNLDNASLSAPDSLPMLWRTLSLVVQIDDLATSNKSFREIWNSRRPSIFSLIKKSLIAPINTSEISQPRDICRSLVVNIAAGSPELLVDIDSFSTLCHLLSDPSLSVQVTAHELLHHASKPYTEHVVLEAEVDTGDDVKPLVPAKLMELIRSLVYETDDDAFPHLLAWMVLFDLFQDASPRVKNSYLDHLRSAGVVEEHFLPMIFSLLSIDSTGRPFSLEKWAVEEFYVSSYDAIAPDAIKVLAAHVYYRALLHIPSLVRSWWSECKDRQLSGAVAAYTSSFISSLIIAQQLAGVKAPEILGSLQSENFAVKVQQAAHEIIAGYTVDEQQMEIGLRIPSDYPLHAIEVRDLKRVAVQETKWRMWLLNVNQIAQTGHLVDALFWFKRNVSSFFDGKVECAICYSIISVTDRTLPNKPCKTCKNRFHASCLYKWFNTSHSSSCPLCRSNIM